MFVCFECCVSGRGLCDGLITRPEESCRLCCVVVCDLETSWMRRPWPTGGCCDQKNIRYFKLIREYFCLCLFKHTCLHSERKTTNSAFYALYRIWLSSKSQQRTAEHRQKTFQTARIIFNGLHPIHDHSIHIWNLPFSFTIWRRSSIWSIHRKWNYWCFLISEGILV